jgi:hypothetical protein
LIKVKKIQNISGNQNGEDLEEKKLLGSGSYAFAKLTEQEEIKVSLGDPHIFRVSSTNSML